MYSDSFCFRGRLGLGENNNNMEDREKIKSVRNANKRDGSKMLVIHIIMIRTRYSKCFCREMT
jgi:hypothetical protein